VRPDEGGERLLILSREAEQVRLGDDVRAVLVKLLVGDIEPDLVELRCPGEQPGFLPRAQVPGTAHPSQEAPRGLLHPSRLITVDVEPLRERVDASGPDILFADSAEEVVQDALPQCTVRRLHRLDAQRLEHGGHHRNPSGKDDAPLRVESLQPQPIHVAGAQKSVLQPLQ